MGKPEDEFAKLKGKIDKMDEKLTNQRHMLDDKEFNVTETKKQLA
jgi:Skp family chaperone for outer membrane proteins